MKNLVTNIICSAVYGLLSAVIVAIILGDKLKYITFTDFMLNSLLLFVVSFFTIVIMYKVHDFGAFLRKIRREREEVSLAPTLEALRSFTVMSSGIIISVGLGEEKKYLSHAYKTLRIRNLFRFLPPVELMLEFSENIDDALIWGKESANILLDAVQDITPVSVCVPVKRQDGKIQIITFEELCGMEENPAVWVTADANNRTTVKTNWK